MKYLILLLCCLLLVIRSEITCTLDPSIPDDNLPLNPACLQFYDNTVGATTGISRGYYSGNDTCGGALLNTLFVAFNVCTLNPAGNQPNCTVYTDCLAASDTFAAYTACLPNTTNNYIYFTAYNTTSYTSSIYSDENCTTFVSASQVPFSCANSGLVDALSADCVIYTNTYPSSDAGALMDSFMFAFLF